MVQSIDGTGARVGRNGPSAHFQLPKGHQGHDGRGLGCPPQVSIRVGLLLRHAMLRMRNLQGERFVLHLSRPSSPPRHTESNAARENQQRCDAASLFGSPPLFTLVSLTPSNMTPPLYLPRHTLIPLLFYLFS
jgi:hypothetical protein